MTDLLEGDHASVPSSRSQHLDSDFSSSDKTVRTAQGGLRWYFSCNRVGLSKLPCLLPLSSGIKYAVCNPEECEPYIGYPHEQVGVARLIICWLLVIIIARSACLISWLKIIALNCCWADDVTCPRSHHHAKIGLVSNEVEFLVVMGYSCGYCHLYIVVLIVSGTLMRSSVLSI